MLFVTFPLLLGRVYLDPTKLFFQHFVPLMVDYWPVYVVLSLMLPFILYDALHVTNRAAGPIFRLRREIEAYRATGHFEPVELRESDFWQEVADHVNELVAESKAAANQRADATPDSELEAIQS